MYSKVRKISIFLAIVIFSVSIFGRETTIIDGVGRKVTLDIPIKKAVVALRYNNELIRAAGGIEQVVGVDMNTAQDREYWPNFSLDSVIGRNQKNLNYEKIISLDPDVLILPSNGTYDEAENKLSPFGIKVVVISGYETDSFHAQLKLIGKIFGTEKRAREVINFYDKSLNYIENSLRGIEKRSVYWESTKDLYTSFPGSYYYNMITASGGENIFSNMYNNTGVVEVDSEGVISRNPQVIIKNITPKTAALGSGISTPPSKEQIDLSIASIKNRPAWNEIDAVKNNNVFIMSQFGHGGASKMIGAVYMAKWIYPDILVDLDPDEVFKIWMEEFQGFKYIDGHFSKVNRN